MSSFYFAPKPEHMHHASQIFGPAEISPVGGYAGNSHFGYVNPAHPSAVNPGWHVTTEIPGLKQGMKISIHDHIKDFNNF